MTMALMGVVAFAQSVTLTFTGRDAAEHWIQLNRVVITNLTKSWQETIYWPDTTLTMQNGTGIDESVANGGFALSQNNPNPFSGTTDVNLTVADAGAVTLEIVDGNGKTVGTHRVRPEIGTHQFRVSLSAVGTYVMTARQNGKASSIKMVCNGGGNANGIDYLGMAQTITFVLKSTTNMCGRMPSIALGWRMAKRRVSPHKKKMYLLMVNLAPTLPPSPTLTATLTTPFRLVSSVG